MQDQAIARFVETPNGVVIVVDVEPPLLLNELAARKYRRALERRLGGSPVILRCQMGSSFAFCGDPHLRRYAVDPMIDVLPAVVIWLALPQQRAA